MDTSGVPEYQFLDSTSPVSEHRPSGGADVGDLFTPEEPPASVHRHPNLRPEFKAFAKKLHAEFPGTRMGALMTAPKPTLKLARPE